MKLKFIVTLANSSVRLRFLAMERSLRATDCDLPLKVIPYDDCLFDLPNNSSWWEIPELISWIKKWNTHPTMRKYQCLTVSNYQFVDADVCFVRNPAKVLEQHTGFVTSCGHWHNPNETVTLQSLKYLSDRSTTWQRSIFNTGQFACDQQLYNFESLVQQCESPHFADTCIHFPFHEQPGVNLLVNASGVQVHNMTLGPGMMQSTWAGDYPGNYKEYWLSEEYTPYLIHWAGTRMDQNRPIDDLFLNYLSCNEKKEWGEEVARKARLVEAKRRQLQNRVRKWLKALKVFVQALNS